ncbi:tRNA (guanosine(46)-N7)-methyltransferase TrmB [Arcicella sp. LKC2W]|uniref:tRNA (guanosine(46)-N7)-methyltransferase TrmB n=1 Tax=Arcicella sp. LKC2W TaxID=2984198 RepID=UPI002B1F3C1E|nr:tRNA (guanosine(46)-N7)-methyltransferase TrmB [Arcicella sp. LKC2W]MEA5458601.1 tRNA (guanosine(46)-N7)-methyltransferase TrmB [Arcicella sp. LKC2W]
MGRQKEVRFKQIQENSNVLQEGKPLFKLIKGNWGDSFFKNSNPIVLELGCGKGEYTVGLGRLFPEKNFIGIDIKGDRIAVGSNQAIHEGLTNVGFLRAKAHDLENFFTENEVSEIWITFPDPHHLQSGVKRRMTNERFLEIYSTIIKDSGLLHLKTDCRPFFDYSLETLTNFGVNNLIHTNDLYKSDLNVSHYGIKTRFEEIFTEKGFSINYLVCEFGIKKGTSI